MEMSLFEIYLVMQADNFGGGLFAIVLMSFMIATVYTMYWAIEKNTFRVHKKVVAICVVAGTLLTIVPTTKTLIAMYGIPQALSSEEVQKVPNNAVKALNKLFEDYLEKETE